VAIIGSGFAGFLAAGRPGNADTDASLLSATDGIFRPPLLQHVL